MKTLKNKFNNLIKRTQDGFFHIVFFAVLFSVLGSLSVHVPELYYRYFDKTEYYLFEQPIEVLNHEVNACEPVYYVGKRRAMRDLDLLITTDLLEVTDEDQYNQVYVYPDKIEATAGEGNILIKGNRIIPCDIPEGTYILRFFTHYKVYGNEKLYRADTESFTVITQQITVK